MTLPAVVSDPGSQQNFDKIGSLMHYGNGSPEGVVAARQGSVYHRFDGGAGTSFYVKESGAMTSTGWQAK